MPRKKKIDELRDWVQDYKAFGFLIKYPTYQFPLCVLASTETEAKAKAETQHPGSETIFLITYLRLTV